MHTISAVMLQCCHGNILHHHHHHDGLYLSLPLCVSTSLYLSLSCVCLPLSTSLSPVCVYLSLPLSPPVCVYLSLPLSLLLLGSVSCLSLTSA